MYMESITQRNFICITNTIKVTMYWSFLLREVFFSKVVIECGQSKSKNKMSFPIIYLLQKLIHYTMVIHSQFRGEVMY